MTHVVTLTGSCTATYKHLSYTNKSRGVIGPLLRKAIEEGLMTEEDMVVVHRDGTAVFLPCKVKAFSAYTIKETDAGLQRKKYVPFDLDL